MTLSSALQLRDCWEIGNKPVSPTTVHYKQCTFISCLRVPRLQKLPAIWGAGNTNNPSHVPDWLLVLDHTPFPQQNQDSLT
jgi:hypothetical protein